MPNPPRSPGNPRGTGDDDGWSVPTRVRFGGGPVPDPPSPSGRAAGPGRSTGPDDPSARRAERPRQPWPPLESAAPAQRPRLAPPPPDRPRYREPARPVAPPAPARPAAPERGLPGWAALLVLVVIAGIGAAIDNARGNATGGGFNIGIIAASVVAILVVRRSGMFPVVIAPPIVYSLGSVFILYLRSGGLSDRHVLFDAASNWLVYGFPAIAAATAAVLIVCGFRLITRR